MWFKYQRVWFNFQESHTVHEWVVVGAIVSLACLATANGKPSQVIMNHCMAYCSLCVVSMATAVPDSMPLLSLPSVDPWFKTHEIC